MMAPNFHANFAGRERAPNYPMCTILDVIKRFVRRFKGGRKSLRRDSESEGEYFRKRTDGWDDEAGRSSHREVTKPAKPNLSDVQSSNFRMRLYYQLNVVKREKEKPWYRYSLSNLKTYSPAKRLKEKRHFMVERSKPITINSRRLNDFHFENSSSKLREVKANQSDKKSDSEDIFVLDIGPISRSCI